MKIEDVTLNTVVEKRDRNYLMQISAPVGEDVRITCYRQVVLVKDTKQYSTGGDNGEKQYMFERQLSQIVGRTIKLPAEAGGYELSAGQVSLALEMLSDVLAIEDQTPAVPEPAPEG